MTLTAQQVSGIFIEWPQVNDPQSWRAALELRRPPAPHPHAAPVARALGRSRKQQAASSWDRAIWQPEDGR